MASVKIKHKILFLFILISLGPLLVVNFVLFITAQKQLKSSAINQQEVSAQQAAEKVDTFLGSKINTLIFQSQTSSTRAFNIPDVSLNLATFIKQDRDLERVALVNKQGEEQVAANREDVTTEKRDVSTSDAFKAATFLAGKEYVGPVNYDENHEPFVVIAVPLIRFAEQQDLTHLSTAEFGHYRGPDDIIGVIIARYNLKNLWQSVLSTQIGKSGYAFVIDDKGNLIAYPDINFLKDHQNISDLHQVEDSLKGVQDIHESISETGVAVLSTHQEITRTNWAVIVEEPLSSVYADVNTSYRLGIVLFVIVAVIAIGLSLLFRKQILTPLKDLAREAKRIGEGEFNYKLPVESGDELGDLAKSFNTMGDDIANLVNDLQKQNVTLETERHKLSSIIQSVSNGIIAIDKNQAIILINPPAAQIIAQAPEALLGRKLSDFFPWQHKNKPASLSLEKPGVYTYKELELPTAERVNYLDLVVTVIEHDTSGIAGILTIHDLTQSRELEIMKLDFVAIAAHELRTPLTIIRGYLNLIGTEKKKLSTLTTEYLRRAIVGANQLGSLINNLLNVSRIERGVMQVTFTKIDLTLLTRQIVDQEQVAARMKKQTLSYTGPDSSIIVPADSLAISEVINNLVSNAMKYAPEGGLVDVRLTTEGDVARVAIHDNGPGIPEEAQLKLFTKFYRVERSLNTGNRGTGLGLYISKAIISLHKGTIGVLSTVGEGSTFFFTLPIFQEEKHGKLIPESKELSGIHGWIAKQHPHR